LHLDSASRPRSILFDIDGTLLRSRGGFAPFNATVATVFGVSVDIRSIRADGMTDPEILARLLDAAPPREQPVTPRLLARFEMQLASALSAGIAAGEVTVESLPGATRLIQALAGRADCRLGIVTGNLRASARVKLRAAVLDAFFHAGGYGSDSPARATLPGLAVERLSRALGEPLDARAAVVVGDTPHDLAAARAHGMRCVLVATGQYSADELSAAAPDVLLPSLDDLEAALVAIGLDV
jgi:phosphoglycolate phosphatase